MARSVPIWMVSSGSGSKGDSATMTKPPINHWMLHSDAVSTEFDDLLGLSETFPGIGPASAGGISGTFADGEVITISSDTGGFGANGPTFDVDYMDGGISGNALTTGTSFFSIVGGTPLFDSAESLTKGQSVNFGGTSSNNAHYDNAGDPFSETFIAYAWKIKSGSNYPGTDTENSFTPAGPITSLWKPVWLLQHGRYTEGQPGEDIVIPTHIASGFQWSGNNLDTQLASVPHAVFSFAGWTTFVYAAKPDAVNPETVNGDILVEIWSDAVNGATGSPHYHNEINLPVFAGAISSDDTWNSVHINSYQAAQGSSVAPLFDFLYVAKGAYANARVVACEYRADHDYSKCTRMIIQPVRDKDSGTYWADGEIQVDCVAGDFSGEQVDIYVIPAGYPENPVYAGTIMAA